MSEERARKMGWAPKEEFRGDPERWVDAETFLDRGENIMPILKERLGKMEAKFDSQTAELTKVTENLHKFAEFHKGTYKRAHAKALKDIGEAKRAAVAAGQLDQYDALDQEEESVKQAMAETDAIDKSQQMSPDFQKFQGENPWYGSDPDLTAYADGLAEQIYAQGLVKTDSELYTEIEKRVRAFAPHKFVNPAREGVADAESGDGAVEGDQSKAKKGFNSLPPEFKAAYNENFTDIMDQEAYAKDAWLEIGEG